MVFLHTHHQGKKVEAAQWTDIVGINMYSINIPKRKRHWYIYGIAELIHLPIVFDRGYW
ncbi:hypothetical protein [Anaerobacillus alkalilacustris]|uniref:hypothetical protein n=1 Tax=Anaerobacillus alkalilacustris TaxID=393763 RepID=UPI001470F06D|nr:hypothetical protein [Anaerobacillus alkalilacustris]